MKVTNEVLCLEHPLQRSVCCGLQTEAKSYKPPIERRTPIPFGSLFGHSADSGSPQQDLGSSSPHHEKTGGKILYFQCSDRLAARGYKVERESVDIILRDH